MSIKTSKRIALGVIASLVFAPFVAIAPASAANAESAVGVVTSIGLTADSTTVQISADSTITTKVIHGQVADTDFVTIKAAVISKPNGSVASITTTKNATDVAAGAAGEGIAFTSPGSTASLGVVRATYVDATDGDPAVMTSANATIGGSASGITYGTFKLRGDTAGSYTLRVWHDATANGTADAGEAFSDIVITVAAGGAIADELPNSAHATAGANGFFDGVKVSLVGVDVTQTSGRVGVQVGFVPQYRAANNTGAGTSSTARGKYGTIAYKVTNPAGTAVTVVSAQGGATTSTSQAIQISATGIAHGTTQSVSPTAGWPQKGSAVYFSTATAGIYTITAWHDADRDGLVDPNEAISESRVEVAADAAPSMTLTTYGQSVPADAANGGIGQLVKISLKNGTLPASLGATEVLTITGPTGTVIDQKSSLNGDFKLAMVDNTIANGADAADSVSTRLTQANFDGNGNAYINVGNSTAGGGTYTLTASIAGGTANGASGSGSFTVVDTTTNPVTRTTANTDKVTGFSNTTGVAYAAGSADRAVSDGNVTPALNVAPNKAITVSVGYLVGAANATATSKTYEAEFTDTYGLVTGLIGGRYDMKTVLGSTATTATTRVSFSVAVPAIASTVSGVAAQIVVLQDDAGVASTTTFTIAQAAATPTNVLVDPSSSTATTYSIRAAAASTNSFTATVMDQYGIAMATQALTAQVTAGRNLQTIATPLVTNANGQASFSVADTYTGTLLLTDTLKFITTVGSKEGVVTINYATYLPTATITMAGGASADVAPTVTYNDINTGASGAAATLVTITATLKDANGALLPAGIPVTWAISGLVGKSAIYVDPDTGYDWKTSMTDSTGKATTYVYAWGTGAVTVTATNNAIVGTGKINFRNVAGDARVVSATATGNVVTAKVVDRYGNAVAGVSITATRTAGTGYFGGNSASSAVAETGENGTVDFVVVGGGATVSVKTTTLNAGQTSSAAGKVGATTITAGSVGEALAPAGVQTATATVAAPAEPAPVYEKPTLSVVKSGGRVYLSGTAEDGEGDIIIYVKRVGTTTWKERAKTLEVAAPGDFNGSIRAPKNNVVIRVKQEGTGLFSNQALVLK